MILSNREILAALEDGRLVIEPSPLGGTDAAALERVFDRTSINLRLGDVLRVPVEQPGIIWDPMSGSTIEALARMYDRVELRENGYVLPPRQFLLGMTAERVALPLAGDLPADVAARGCLAGRVEGKSSLARLGLLVHFTAPTIHAGFEGTIALEMMNLGPAPILLRPGMFICQLILEPVMGEPFGSGGQFFGQGDPSGRS